MSKRKKSEKPAPQEELVADVATAEEMIEPEPEPEPELASESEHAFDAETTVNLAGEHLLPGRDDLEEPTVEALGESTANIDSIVRQRKHLRGLLEALVFAADSPITPKELAKLAHAPQKQVKELLEELKQDYAARGMHLDEVNGGFCFRTSPQYAPFVRDLTKQKPVRLTRAQVETLAIIAYRQPITRPEVDDVRGVDSGPVLKLLLERDLVRILGKRDEVGRPLIYGTTGAFLEFFGLKSLKDLPTLREFTELSDESRDAFEEELGETPPEVAPGDEPAGEHHPVNDDELAGEHHPVSETVPAGGLEHMGDEQLEALAELERLEAEDGLEDEEGLEDETHEPDGHVAAVHDDVEGETEETT